MARNTVRNRVPFARGGVKRAMKWISSADVTDKVGLAAASSVLSQSFTAAQLQAVAQAGGTIVRTRGSLWVQSDQVTATEEPVGAMGMMIVREQARVAGITAIPTPVTESFDDGFFVHQWFQAGVMFVQLDATGFQFNGTLWQRYDFDSKAQRKFTADSAIVVTVENSSAADGMDFMLQFRILLMPGLSR